MHNVSLKFILVVSVVLSVLASVFFSRWITAKISILPILNRLNLLSPQSPIVIKETVETRVSPEGEVSQTLEQLKARVSQLGTLNKGTFETLGSALNFTSDGVYVSSSLGLPAKFSGLHIRARDNKLAEVIQIYTDKDSGLVFLKTSQGGILAAGLAEVQKLKLGDRLLFFSDYPTGLKYFETQVNFLPEKLAGNFAFQNSGIETVPGMAVSNLKGEILGIWHNRIITAEQIKTAFDNYLRSLVPTSKTQ